MHDVIRIKFLFNFSHLVVVRSDVASSILLDIYIKIVCASNRNIAFLLALMEWVNSKQC